METFHKVTCPKCDHNFTFHEVKKKVKESWLKRLIGKTIFIGLLILIGIVMYVGIRGMLPNETGVPKAFWEQIPEEIP